LLVEKICKQAADVPAESLRDIFDKECRNDPGSANSLSFGLESSMYKRRQINQPSLPRTVDEVGYCFMLYYWYKNVLAITMLAFSILTAFTG